MTHPEPHGPIFRKPRTLKIKGNQIVVFLLLLNSLIINGSFETLTFEIRHHRPPPDPKNQYRDLKSTWGGGSPGYPYLQPVLFPPIGTALTQAPNLNKYVG